MKADQALTPREMRVVRALLVHPLGEKAAEAAGVGLRTLRRYQQRDHVRAAVTRGALVRLQATTTALARYAEDATEALGQMAVGTIPADAARVSACRAVIAAARSAVEVEFLAERLTALEAEAAARKMAGGRGWQ